MSMNLTGFELTEGQRLEIRIVNEAQEAKIKADNDKYLKELIQTLIDEELNARETDEEDYDPFAELADAEDWTPWNEPQIEDESPFIFNFSKNRYYEPINEYRNILKTNTYSTMYGDPGYEYRCW